MTVVPHYVAPSRPGPIHDPPGSPAVAPLTEDELKSVMTGSGHPPRDRVPSPEDNPDLYPRKARGYYPDPGHYERVGRRNPIAAAGLTKFEYYVPSLDWRIELERPSDAEARQIELCVQWLDAMPGGLGRAIRLMATAPQYGFSIQEIVYGETPEGLFYPRELLWVRPGTIEAWIVDRAWREVGFLQIAEEYGAGETRSGPTLPSQRRPISLGKCLHFAWRYRSRAPEGESAFRPLFYYDQFKGEELRDDRISRRKWGGGTLTFIEPETPGGDLEAERVAVEDIAQQFIAGEIAYMIMPAGWEVRVEYGGSDRPDPIPMLEYLDHQHARLLDDTLGELGMSRYGSHAVAQDLRLSTQRQLTGVCAEMANVIEQQLLARLWRANGWEGRVPNVVVTGFEDQSRLTAIVQLAQQGLIDVTDPGVRQQIHRAVGLVTTAPDEAPPAPERAAPVTQPTNGQVRP